jgi:tRNA (Thr-GGU) A37 N-methylase
LTINPVIRDTTKADICSSGLPYRWKGKNYTITGTYFDTLRSATACDTFAVLNLTVYPGKVDTTRSTICSNNLPYLWRGRSLTTAGTYRDTIAGVSGCDSVSILLLTINPVIRDTTRADVCASQLPYRWKGRTYSVTGTYLDTLRSTTACDTFAVLNLFVYPIRIDTTSATVCSNNLPFTWRGRNLTVTGTYRDTIAGLSSCDSVFVLLLTINPVIRDTTKADICSSALPYRWKGKNYTITGTYLDTLRSATACDTFAVLNLTVYPGKVDTTRSTICANQLPFTWRSRSLTTAGTYRDTIAGVSGCDSVSILLLTINPVIRDTTRADVCASQLPYRWKGRTYSMTGTYLDTLRSTTACDTFAVLNLLVYPIRIDTTRASVCSNKLPYLWRGRNLTVTGTYRDTIAGLSSCDSVFVLLLTINPVIRDTTKADICSSALPYRWKGKNYTITGTYLDTLRSATACDTFAVLNLTVYPGKVDTTRSTICANQLPFTWRSRSLTTAGTFRDTIAGVSGCDSVSVLLLTINPVIRDTTRADVCASQLPYRWKGRTYSMTGTYLDTLRSTTACDTFAVLNLFVYPIRIDTNRATVCSNNLPYNWRGRNLTVTGTYRDTISGLSSCDSVFVLLLTVNPVIRDTTTADICSSGLPYRWKGKNYTITGTYLDTIRSATACDTFAVLKLTVYPGKVDTTRATVCTNKLPFTWRGRSLSTAGTYRDTIVGVSVCDSVSILLLTINPVIRDTTRAVACANNLPYRWKGSSYTNPGTYLKTVPSTNTCDTFAVLVLSISEIPRDTTRVTICANQTPYNWNGVGYSTSGTYSQTIPGTGGCDTYAVLELVVNPVIREVANIAVCVNKLPYIWRGTAYNAAGSYQKNIPGTIGCDTLAVLNLSVNPVNRDTTRATVCSNNLPFSWKGKSFSQSGTYLNTSTSFTACDTFSVLILTVNPIIRDTLRISTCANKLPYRWRGTDYSTSGTYLKTVPGINACDTFAVLQFTIKCDGLCQPPALQLAW